ncbi:hypothetical protein BKA65DRAFT_549091 [Rhexocercosporidium sp. MPI-PUGE-AT-0058]|nr:hypothetical protein BKA65DRAFT_549091 [Rhexocercosporidium sp. MPI-PUGE-AT-0058]
MEFSGSVNDESIGPTVEGCRGDFGFTIKVERICFVLISTTTFSAICLRRILYLIRRPVIVYSAVQLVLLALSIAKSRKFEALFISSSATTFASTMCILAKLSKFTIQEPRNRKHSLARATAKGLLVPLLLPLGLRVALGAFQFCQPFLLNSLPEYLQIPAEESSHNHDYGLIGATALIFTVIATSGAIYSYLQERAMYMMRGVLVSIVYRKTIEAKISAADDSAALTLMSADVERGIRGLLNIHQLWANTIEVAVASWLLSRLIGASFVAPLVVVVCCVSLSTF